MTSARRDRYVRLEARARRAVGEGVLHPDQCPKLTLRGVAFAIPSRGVRVVPEFAADGVRASIAGLDSWPEADRVLQLAEGDHENVCPECRRPLAASIKVDLDRNRAFLVASFDLAEKLLAEQYELSDEEKSELLAFSVDQAPTWLIQLLQWCRGLPTEAGQ